MCEINQKWKAKSEASPRFNRNRFYFVVQRGGHVKQLRWDEFSSDWIEAGYTVVTWYRV